MEKFLKLTLCGSVSPHLELSHSKTVINGVFFMATIFKKVSVVLEKQFSGLRGISILISKQKKQERRIEYASNSRI